jgi:hypothetical protein
MIRRACLLTPARDQGGGAVPAIWEDEPSVIAL